MVAKRLTAAVLTAALLSACSTTGKETASNTARPVYGDISSDRGGGNAKLAATGTGTLVGAFLAKDSDSLAKSDIAKRDEAARGAYAAPIGEKVTWTNAESGHSGSVISIRDGWNNAGEYCREFRQEIGLRDRTLLSYGTACKRSDGSWSVVTPSQT